MQTLGRWLRTAFVVALSPLLEKQPLKLFAIKAPIVFSMTRLIPLGFSVAMIRQVWKAGVAGWPDAITIATCILALPLLEALSRVDPEKVLGFGEVLLNRFGVGDARKMGSVFTEIEKRRDPVAGVEPTP